MATKTFKDIAKDVTGGNPSYKGYTSYQDLMNSDRNHVYLDDDYLAEIEKYKGTRFYDYLLTNPWLAGNQADFSPNFWQGLSEEYFSDFSQRDSYYASLRSQRSQWLSDALEKFRQEDYNSASSQAERERAAGINPDLAGNITPGDAAENDQPMSDIEMPNKPGGSVAEQIGSMSLNFVSQIIGMADSVIGMSRGMNDIVHQELSNNDTARKFVLDTIAGTSFFNSENDLDNMTPGDLANNILKASGKVDYSGYSPRTRKLIQKMFNSYAKDVKSGKSPMAVEALKSELRKRIVDNNSNAAKGASSPLFDEDFNSFIEKIAKAFGDYQLQVIDVEKKELKERSSRADAGIAKNNYDTSYFHGLDAGLASKAFNASNEATSVTEGQTAKIEGLWDKIYDICVNSDSWYGTLGLVLIPFFRSMIQNTSVGIGRYGKAGKFGFTGINF